MPKHHFITESFNFIFWCQKTITHFSARTCLRVSTNASPYSVETFLIPLHEVPTQNYERVVEPAVNYE